MGYCTILVVVISSIEMVFSDFSCICNYQPSLPVYANASKQAYRLGTLDEFMCKAEFQSGLQSWFAVQYMGKIGYIDSSGGMVMQQTCPGNPPINDRVSTQATKGDNFVNFTTVAQTTKHIFQTTPASLAVMKNNSSIQPTSRASIIPVFTTEKSSVNTTSIDSPIHANIFGNTQLCHDSLLRWSWSHPNCRLYQFRDKCYLVDSNIFNIFDVMPGACSLSGGKMLSIMNLEEHNFVTNFVKNTIGKPVWIAYNSPRILYRWPARTSSAGFTNWYSSPGYFSGTHNCGLLMPDLIGGKWIFADCYESHFGICQYPVFKSPPAKTSAQTIALTPLTYTGSTSANGILPQQKSTSLHDIFAHLIGNIGQKTTPGLGIKTTHRYVTTQDPTFNPAMSVEGDLSKCQQFLVEWKNNVHLLFQWDTKCYALDTTSRTNLAVAQGVCGALGGTVVDIDNQQEQDAIQRFLQNQKYQDKVLIGFTNSFTNNIFHWSSGAPGRYTNWAPLEPRLPSHKSLDCTVLNPRNGGLWESRLCIEPNVPMCEYATVR